MLTIIHTNNKVKDNFKILTLIVITSAIPKEPSGNLTDRLGDYKFKTIILLNSGIWQKSIAKIHKYWTWLKIHKICLRWRVTGID